MANVAIYYQEKKHESTETAIEHINILIQLLETHHIIKGIFIDRYNSQSELMELFNTSLSHIDYLYIEKPFDYEFDYDLLMELSRTEQFEIRYFKEI